MAHDFNNILTVINGCALMRDQDHSTDSRRAGATPTDRPVVLLVDDDDNVRSFVRHVLAGAGFAVLAAPDPESALALLAAHIGPLDLLLTDLVMPGMSGRELTVRVRTVRPLVRVLFISGSIPDESSPSGHADEPNFLPKPFTPAQLTESVNRVLDRPV